MSRFTEDGKFFATVIVLGVLFFGTLWIGGLV